jgi:CxxC motif-containing protein (DUF1111 family)
MKTVFNLAAGVAAVAWVGCGGAGAPAEPDALPTTIVNASDVPLDGLSAADVAGFDDGDALFDVPFREVDGLGPLFIRSSCSACHAEGGRGPGLVQKMAIVGPDGVTPAADQSALAYGHTIRRGLAAGAAIAITPPARDDVKVTTRLGPPVLGRGYLEAIDDAEIERVEREQAARSDGIHGRINRVTFASVPNPDTTFSHHTQGETNLIGRFGLKARIVSLDEFTADAYQGDMGMTTPMRQTELPNPDGLTDDARPGVDLAIDHVDRVAFYLRRIAIPRRVGLTEQGAALFEQARCSACHVPSLRTRADFPIAQLAGIDAPVFTDLLLHDLGDALADGMTDGSADARAWRTAPLVGLRFMRTYLHDGRAATIDDAIRAHDGEARDAADRFRALSDTDRQALLDYVQAL